MPMKLFNTLTRTQEELVPLSPPAVSMYVCGPTVYDVPHIGHARSAYTFDVLRRYLEFRGFTVRFVRNVTDVDDKIIDRAKQEPNAARDLATACRAVAERYLAAYHGAMDRLGIRRPDLEPKATEHVIDTPSHDLGSMTDLISQLLLKGAAYEAKGDVYFAVRKFDGYGKLSNRSLDELQAGARIEPGEGKQDPLDFALWKAAKPGEPSWKSPWGAGRPGWHIECSAMSTKYLGDAFDIHGGGVDLVFPHHENEAAQAQAAGKPFARMWVHNGLLTVKGEKMSKSLGNYTTVDDAFRQAGGSADVLKLMFLGTQYRSPLDYTPEAVAAARARLGNLVNAFQLGHQPEGELAAAPRDQAVKIDALRQEFTLAMDHDVNTPQALAALDGLASIVMQARTELTRAQDPASGAALRGAMRLAASTLQQLATIAFGLTFEAVPIPEEVKRLAQQREEARKRKDYQASDALRRQISDLGFQVEDTPKGPALVPKS